MSLIICSGPMCQTSAGCICQRMATICAPTPDPAVMRDYIDRLTRFYIDNPQWVALAEEARGYIGALAERTQAPAPSIRSEPPISESPAGALTAEKAGSDTPHPVVEIESVRGDVTAWLEDRRDNCFRLAKEKTGKDRDGWLDDAKFFHLAIELLVPKSTVADPRGDSALPPSSARERREIIEECAKVAEQSLGYVEDGYSSENAVVKHVVEAIRSLSSDGRGREKGNTSNSDDGIDPAPPATDRSEL